jgi:NAD(P)-dependent dehydrogenase (short-subunit alcohol dehydrogenase family)
MVGRVNPEELKRCINILESVTEDAVLLSRLSEEDRVRLLKAAGRLVHPDRLEARKRLKTLRTLRRREKELNDREARATTGIRAARRDAVYVPPPRQITHECAETALAVLKRPRDCYVCKAKFDRVHFFYDSMCPACAAFNYEKRFQTARLEGRAAVITGARLKIGYQAALMLLRAGARVAVTTRFPQDAAMRYAREKDYADWSARLSIHGLDLRHPQAVEMFCEEMSRELGRLDILVNNAAQTVRRPPEFYRHLLDGPPKHVSAYFPVGKLDADLQQIDLRPVNSWRMRLADVPTDELLEVQLVNAIAPYILCARLKPLMLRDRTDQKHIVNVSAMEGQFARHTKTDKHPHTNMAKAALNMMTFTSARDYAKDGIYMNAVDTGWVTDEDPAAISARKQDELDFQPPLDIVDGAARVCDPIFSGLLTGKHSWGNFFKDYRPVAW